jgi:hypothetical protein
MRRWFLMIACLCLCFAPGTTAKAQAPAAHGYDAAEIAAAKAAVFSELTARRDAFIKATEASGLTCAVAPPKLVVEDVPSYGSYNPETNTFRTSLWELLRPEERGLFFRMADAANKTHDSDEVAARREFETGVHHWVFIHELGHWWQACRKVNGDERQPWAIEYEADRIAAAYWRQADAAVADHMDEGFQVIVAHTPNPVPAGKEPEKYFDDNYQRLGPTPAYVWFQSEMCVKAFAEKPKPTFLQTLKEAGHP